MPKKSPNIVKNRPAMFSIHRNEHTLESNLKEYKLIASTKSSLRLADFDAESASDQNLNRKVGTEEVMKVRKDPKLAPKTIVASFRSVCKLRQLIGDSGYIFVVSATHGENQVSISPDIHEQLIDRMSELTD